GSSRTRGSSSSRAAPERAWPLARRGPTRRAWTRCGPSSTRSCRGCARPACRARASRVSCAPDSASPLGVVTMKAQLIVVAFLVAFTAVYLRAHRRAKPLAAPRAAASSSAASASLVPEQPSDLALPLAACVASLALGAWAFAHARAAYPLLPERVPTHFG